MAKEKYEYHAIVLEDDFEDKVVTFEDEHTAELYSKAKRDEGKPSYTYRQEKPKCIGCGKHPEDIDEYAKFTNLGDLTPSQWVRENEPVGVWGARAGANAFYCTTCYIKAGQPLRKS